MPLSAHTLGSTIDFLSSGYLTDAEGDRGENPTATIRTATFALTDGARAVSRRVGAMVRTFHVICLGADFNASRANADLLEDALVIAFSAQSTASPSTYIEQDTTESVPVTWKCCGGIYQRDYQLRPAGLVSGTLTLHLSKS